MSATNYDQIPELLIDKMTYLEKNKPNYLPNHHTQFTYLFCILLRIFIGILILNNNISQWFILLLSSIILISFSSVYYNIVKNKRTVWKNYQRNIIIYLTIIITQLSKSPNKNSLSGLLIIVDALMGQQSRYITTNMSRNAPN